MKSHIDHPGWDPSWAVPSEHTIDDLAELGLLRVEPSSGKSRTFVPTVAGRQAGDELDAQFVSEGTAGRAPSAVSVLRWLQRVEDAAPECFELPARLMDRAVSEGLIDSSARDALARRVLRLIADGYLEGTVYDWDQATPEQQLARTEHLALTMKGHMERQPTRAERSEPTDTRPPRLDTTAVIRDVRDVFISHASEDKELVARPLARALVEHGLTVWYDEYDLNVGDRLSSAIDRGLASSRSGVVIVSQNFIRKPWPKRELSGLVARETSTGESVILPVWHEVTHEEVLAFSPPLADVLAASTRDGLDAVVSALLPAVMRRRAQGERAGRPLPASEL
jgi:hypothetical protein